MRGTVLKLRSKSGSCLELDGCDDEENLDAPDGCSLVAGHTNKELTQDTQLKRDARQDPSANPLFQIERKRAWMSSLDLNSIPSSLHSSPWNNSSSSSSCHQPTFSWNGPAMWKAMAEHPLFPRYMELQAKLLETYETIQSDCKKAACEKALASLYMNSAAAAAAANKSHPSNSVYVPETKLKKDRWSAQNSVSYEKMHQIMNSRRSLRSVRSSPSSNHDLLSAWSCMKCSRPFAGLKWLQKHQAVCNISAQKGKCNICLKSFKSLKWLEKHQALCSASKSFGSDSDLQDSFKEALCQNSDKGVENMPCENVESMSNEGKSESLNVIWSTLSPKRNGVVRSVSSPKRGYGMSCVSSPKNNSVLSSVSPTRKTCISPIKKEQCLPKIDTKEKNSFVKVNVPKANPTFKSAFELSDDYSIQKLGVNGDVKSKMETVKARANKRRKFLCIGCLKIIRNKKSLAVHRGSCIEGKHGTPESSNRCSKCCICFTSNNKLLKHQVFCCPTSDNKMLKYLKCMKCSKIFPNRKKQIRHRAVCCPDSDTDSMVCRNCSSVFLKKERILAHMAKCNRSK